MISVVVCTRDRAGRLARTLASYEGQTTTEAWELCVVVNASIDDTAVVVEHVRATSDLPIRVLTEPRPGVCAARNAGWQAARGDIVAFVDDDCYPDAAFLRQLRTCFDDFPIGYVGGPMRLHDPHDLSTTSIQTSEHRVDLPPRSVFMGGLIHGGNMAFRRGVLVEIGGFDERLGAGTPLRAGGDLDALSRASIAGHAGAYDPRPGVAHHHGRKTAAEGAAVTGGYDVGRGAYYLKCLLDPRRRWLYAVPILRRAAGHLLRFRFGTLRNEVVGAMRYVLNARGPRRPVGLAQWRPEP